MKRRRSHRPGGRAARFAALGLLAGAIAGAAVAGDIEKSYRKGRVAPAAVASALPIEPAEVAAGDDEFGLVGSHGFSLASALGFTSREDCRGIEPPLRAGCLDYVAQRRSGALEPVEPLL